jgi:hypothetical protein
MHSSISSKYIIIPLTMRKELCVLRGGRAACGILPLQSSLALCTDCGATGPDVAGNDAYGADDPDADTPGMEAIAGSSRSPPGSSSLLRLCMLFSTIFPVVTVIGSKN